MTALLEVDGLRAGYGRLAVIFDVSLTVGEGEVVAVLGRNGAGKTTTLRAISGMLPLMAGRVRFAGEDATGKAPEGMTRRGMLHVPAGRGIFPSLRVDESLRLAASLARLPAAESAARIDEVFATFPPLASRRGLLAGALSGGEQQMLALARALVWRPRLLLVDEMSQGLAPNLVQALFERIELFRARGTAVLLVEQFVGGVLGVADRGYVLEKGRVVHSAAAADLSADQDLMRASYLGATSGARHEGAGGRT